MKYFRSKIMVTVALALLALGVFYGVHKKTLPTAPTTARQAEAPPLDRGRAGKSAAALKGDGVQTGDEMREQAMFRWDFVEAYLSGYESAKQGHTFSADYTPPVTDVIRPGYVAGWGEGWLKGCEERKGDCGAAKKVFEDARSFSDYPTDLVAMMEEDLPNMIKDNPKALRLSFEQAEADFVDGYMAGYQGAKKGSPFQKNFKPLMKVSNGFTHTQGSVEGYWRGCQAQKRSCPEAKKLAEETRGIFKYAYFLRIAEDALAAIQGEDITFNQVVGAGVKNTHIGKIVSWKGMVNWKESQLDGIKFWPVDGDHTKQDWKDYEWFWAVDPATWVLPEEANGHWTQYLVKKFTGLSDEQWDSGKDVFFVTGKVLESDCTFYDPKLFGKAVCIPNIEIISTEKL